MAAVVAQPLPFAEVNGRRYAAFPNDMGLYQKDSQGNVKKDAQGKPIPKSNLDHVIDFFKSSNGAFRCLQFLERVTKVAVLVLKEMGSSMVGFFDDLAGKFGLAWQMLTIPRLPEVTKKAKDAVAEWLNPPAVAPLDAKRDKVEKVHDLADAAAAWGYAGSLVAGSISIKNTADVFNLVADVTDLQMAAQDWWLSKKHLEIIDVQNPDNAPVHNRFVDTMRWALIKMVKAISSVVSGVIGLMVLALGAPILPVPVLVALGMIATTAAISAHFFKEKSPFEMVDYFKIRNPEVLVAGAPAA